jgi:hypothetical protein
VSVFQLILSRFTKVHREHLNLPYSPPSSDTYRPIEALLAQAKADQKYAPDFFRSLLNLELVAIVRKKGGAGRHLSPAAVALMNAGLDSDLELVEFRDAAGAPFVPVFSNRDFLPDEELAPDFRVIETEGRKILSLARGRSRVVLNPGRVHSRVFESEDLETILDRLTRKPLHLTKS